MLEIGHWKQKADEGYKFKLVGVWIVLADTGSSKFEKCDGGISAVVILTVVFFGLRTATEPNG